MRRNLLQWTFLALLPVLPVALPALAADADEDQIRKSFLGYKDAILRQQGEAAVNFVNRATIDYYTRMKELALTGAEPDVRKLTTLDKLMVLSLRHRLSLEELRFKTPEQILAHGVDQGWIGKESVTDSEIGKIEIKGDDASGEYLKGGRAAPMKYRFTKEDGVWKMDLTALFDAGNQAIAMVLKSEGLEEDDFLLGVLGSVSGREVPDSIWQPPGP